MKVAVSNKIFVSRFILIFTHSQEQVCLPTMHKFSVMLLLTF
jgi:hypothetical protein